MWKARKRGRQFSRDKGCPVIGNTRHRYPLNLPKWGGGGGGGTLYSRIAIKFGLMHVGLVRSCGNHGNGAKTPSSLQIDKDTQKYAYYNSDIRSIS